MAGRHPAGMKPRDERAHPVIKDAMDKGHLGTGKPYHVDGFATREAANEGRKAINNAARHLNVACSSKEKEHIEQLTDGTWRVTFTLYTKSQARKYLQEQTGGDPSKLAYNPFRRAEGPLVSDDGARI